MAKKVNKEAQETQVTAAAAVKAPKAAKPKAAKAPKEPKAAKPKAEPKPKAVPAPQLSKDDVQAAVYAAVKAAVAEVRAAEPVPEIKVELQPAPKPAPKPVKYSAAEKILNFMAYFYLVAGILASIACLVVGITLEATEDSFMAQYIDGPDMGSSLIGAGIGLVIPTLVQFATLKLLVNISHRLSSLDEK